MNPNVVAIGLCGELTLWTRRPITCGTLSRGAKHALVRWRCEHATEARRGFDFGEGRPRTLVTPFVPVTQRMGLTDDEVMEVNDSTREAIHVQQLEVGMEMA